MHFRYNVVTRAEPTIVSSQRAVSEFSSGRGDLYSNRNFGKGKKQKLNHSPRAFYILGITLNDFGAFIMHDWRSAGENMTALDRH